MITQDDGSLPAVNTKSCGSTYGNLIMQKKCQPAEKVRCLFASSRTMPAKRSDATLALSSRLVIMAQPDHADTQTPGAMTLTSLMRLVSANLPRLLLIGLWGLVC